MKDPDEIKPSKQEIEEKRVDTTISSREISSVEPVIHFYQPSQVGVFTYSISYVMLDENGTVLMAGRGNNRDNSPLFLAEGKSKTSESSSNSNSTAINTSNDQNKFVSNPNNEEDPFTHVYIGYNGVLEQEGVCKDIQVFFMAQPTGAPIKNADHSALNNSMKSIINKHRVAVEPGKESVTYQGSSWVGSDGTVHKAEWTVTPEKCLFGSNKITLNFSGDQHYFCGECKPSKVGGLTILDMKKMIGHTLEGITFNTKGTVTKRFKEVKITDIESREALHSNIPEKCMKFTMKPANASGDFDDDLSKTISTPDRRRKYQEKLFQRVKRQKSIEEGEFVKKRESSFFKDIRRVNSVEIDPMELEMSPPSVFEEFN
jgi:hypothetical protein